MSAVSGMNKLADNRQVYQELPELPVIPVRVVKVFWPYQLERRALFICEDSLPTSRKTALSCGIVWFQNSYNIGSTSRVTEPF